MVYKIYTVKTYDGKYKMGVAIDDTCYTNVGELSWKLMKLELVDDIKDFKKQIKPLNINSTLTFKNEESMNVVKGYIESLLIFGKLMEV